MTHPLNVENGRMVANARMYRPNPALDRVADMYEKDREAWEKLPARTKDGSIIHLDLRAMYRAAVQAGLVPDDRGPSAA